MDLVPFSSVDRTALRWLRTAESPAAFSLLSGDATVATLSWNQRGGSLATATTAEVAWTFKRAGFLAPTVTARVRDQPQPVAQVAAHLRSHDLRLRGGPSYRLQHVSRLVPSWRLTGEHGEEVLHIEPVAERGSLRGGAVVVSSHADAPEALLLITLSWYFVVLSWFEDELVEALAPFEGPDAPARLEWPT